MNAYKQSIYSAIIRVSANILMVAAVFVAMYQASRWPGWPSEAVFCIVFFSITIPAWLAAWQLIRWTRRRWPGPAQSLVSLPGLGSQLVTWQIRKPAGPAPVLPRKNG